MKHRNNNKIFTETTRENLQLFKEMVDEEPENNKYSELQRCRKYVKSYFECYGADQEETWNAISRRLIKQRRRKLWLRCGYAASVMILICSAWIYRGQHVESMNNTSNRSSSDSISVKVPQLIVSSGEVLDLCSENASSISEMDGGRLNVQNAELSYLNTKKVSSSNHMKWNTLRTPAGAEYNLVLSDGTVVWINALTEIKYPTTFQGDERLVYVRGEAFFSVAKDSTKPFVVEGARLRTKVLGTEFNYCSYDVETCDVTLLTGKVLVSDVSDQTIEKILGPGDNLNTQGDQLTLTQGVNLDKYMGWRKGFLYYEGERLESMMRSLERWYDFSTAYSDSEIKDYVFTAWFSREDTFDQIVKKLEETGRLQVKIENRKVYISNVRR